MAYANTIRTTETGFGNMFASFAETVKRRMAQRRAFLSTLHELRSLSDRELSDLGLSRASLRSIAYEAAYEAH